MAVMLGGAKAWKQRVLGDVVMSYQWIDEQPSLVLWPLRKRSLNAGAYALGLDVVHKYVKADGHPISSYLIPQAIIAAEVMGMDSTTYTVRNIADAIMDGLEDLINMPPEPVGMNAEQHAGVVGEALIQVNGRTILHDEITAPTEMH